MTHRRIASWSAAAVLAGLATASHAHDTWLLPSRSHASPGDVVELAMTSGMAFPANESAIGPERLARAAVRLAGDELELSDRREDEEALSLRAPLPSAGVATAFVELAPRTIELTAEDVAHYLEEVGAPPSVLERWRATPEQRRWRESYRKHTKTYVRVGSAATDRSWAEPVGSPLEIVPESDPTQVPAGGSLTARLLRDGTPLAGATVALVRAGESAAVSVQTDAAGRATFSLPAAGWYLLRSTDLRPAKGPDLDWESDFATLTFDVRPSNPETHQGE